MLISEDYKKQNYKLHLSGKKYGHRGHMHLEKVQDLMKSYKCKTVLDYGCGKADLDRVSDFEVINYDPALPEYAEDPKQCDLVICTDVLEHIEPDCLDDVLTHMREKMNRVGYFVINTREDKSKTLPDGTNPHKIIKSYKWWIKKLGRFFKIKKSWTVKHHCYFLVG